MFSILFLQPDNSQTTVQLLSLIALQNGAPTDVQPFLNETAEALPRSTTFRAPRSAVTINTLWFTSLVLSLAAALLGILAKQWCREFLRWHSVIASARENVLIRQVRFEAWERWRVPSLIAAIPAFLEIALVLFLIGLLVLVPTFAERVLTIVLSAVTGSTLLGTAVLTLLPVFFRLCPFQSPTGWAFVRLTGLLHTSTWACAISAVEGLYLLLQRLEVERRNWLYPLYRRSAIKLKLIERLNSWRSYGLYAVENLQLCEAAVLGIRSASNSMNVDDPRKTSVDVMQTRALSRALSWVLRGSKDRTVLAAIQESLLSVHLVQPTTAVLSKSHVLSSAHAICSADLLKLCEMVQSFIHQDNDNTLAFRTGPHSPFQILGQFGPFMHPFYDADFSEAYHTLLAKWESDTAYFIVWHSLLRSDLLSLVDDWLSVMADTSVRQTVAKRIAFVFIIWRFAPVYNVSEALRLSGAELAADWAQTLQVVYHKLGPHEAASSDGLTPMCVELCRLLGPVRFQHAEGEPRIIGECIDSVICDRDEL